MPISWILDFLKFRCGKNKKEGKAGEKKGALREKSGENHGKSLQRKEEKASNQWHT